MGKQFNRIIGRNEIYCPFGFKLHKKERINLGTNFYVFSAVSAIY
jgi:hypothetical protein